MAFKRSAVRSRLSPPKTSFLWKRGFLFVCVKDRVRVLAPLFSSNHQSLLRAIIGAFPDLISGNAICFISPAQNFIEFFVFFC